MCQTPFLVKIVSDHFLANQKRVRHLFKCQNWPKFPGVNSSRLRQFQLGMELG